jgi:hypothetical protein
LILFLSTFLVKNRPRLPLLQEKGRPFNCNARETKNFFACEPGRW